MVSFRGVDTTGAKVIIDSAIERARNLSDVLNVIGRRAVSEVKLNFQEGGRVPDGWTDSWNVKQGGSVNSGKWYPLSPDTILARRREGRGHKILIDTGILMNSITYKVEGNTLLVGTNVPYGAYHQHGTKNMIARPFLTFLQEIVREFQGTFQRLIEGKEGT